MIFIIHHTSNPHAYIKTVVAPPRLCEWTKNMSEAQVFEVEREADAAAKYITENAFNVTVKQI